MSGHRLLDPGDLGRLVGRLIEDGIRVFGPSVADGRCDYRRIRRADDLDLAAGMPALPLKSLFLQPTEVLFSWRRTHNDVALTPGETVSSPAVVIGARPCDAAGVDTLDAVMGWDYRDPSWFDRRAATTIVTLACEHRGPDCFCDAVGLSPRSTVGADVLLTRRQDGRLHAAPLTEKGEALLARCPETTPGAEATAPDGTEAAAKAPLDLERVRTWLSTHFDDPLWDRLGLRCHGCGACAAVCPTCHCFDIVDEPDGLLTGTRRRNWDTCQSSRFTVHASGHNPRANQAARFRQRILHKFSIYPERFGRVLCTGCGRCAAACPAGQHLGEILDEVASL